MDSVHHIWCPLSSQEYQDLPDGAETTLTNAVTHAPDEHHGIHYSRLLFRGAPTEDAHPL
ncbi:hypothetical protein HX37_22775 [Salmonella enterica]|uniref:Uncharacterized protein n=1 Tax=Salmonella enterica TaxID=28901 RepID=A0A5U2F6M4_SALER|nr:hypothetical protein [Salmonella enterica]